MTRPVHTPGPWGYYFGDGEIEIFAERSIADLYIYLEVEPTDKAAPTEADIHLIAAAPELLETIRELCMAAEYTAGCDEGASEDVIASDILSSQGSPMFAAYTKARALIAKAGGQS